MEARWEESDLYVVKSTLRRSLWGGRLLAELERRGEENLLLLVVFEFADHVAGGWRLEVIDQVDMADGLLRTSKYLQVKILAVGLRT